MIEATKPVRWWQNRSNELALFNKLDHEYIYQSAAMCIVRLLDTTGTINDSQDVYNDVYNEAVSKVYTSPVEIAASFSPVTDVMELAMYGMDTTKTLIAYFNYIDWHNKFKRVPRPGDLVKSPEFNYIYIVADVQRTDPVYYDNPMHYQVTGKLSEDLQLETFMKSKSLIVKELKNLVKEPLLQ